METNTKEVMGLKLKINILNIIIFAVAFAFVEASVVVYLRHLLGASYSEIGKGQILLPLPGIAFLQPDTALKVIQDSALLNIEMIREGATLVMLAVAATLAGKGLKRGLAFFFLAFGIWDIFYYVFLKLTIGWPKSFSDLDIFFLLPVPWVGPIIVPLLISSVLVIGSFMYLWRNKAY